MFLSLYNYKIGVVKFNFAIFNLILKYSIQRELKNKNINIICAINKE